MTESIIAIGAVCAAIVAIWGLIEKISKPIKEINNKLSSFGRWQSSQQEDIEMLKTELEIICRGFRALCLWAITQGANGEIHKPLEELNQFLSRKSHEGKSYINKG